MKIINILLVILVSSLFLSSCGETKKIKTTVTKTGILTIKSGEEYLLKTDSEIVNITSNKINLDLWIKKPIRVTGMYSGSTLYVDKIESAITN